MGSVGDDSLRLEREVSGRRVPGRRDTDRGFSAVLAGADRGGFSSEAVLPIKTQCF